MRVLRYYPNNYQKLRIRRDLWIIISAILILTVIPGCAGWLRSRPGSTDQPVSTMQNATTDPVTPIIIATTPPTLAPTEPKSVPKVSFSSAVPETLIELVRQSEGVNTSQRSIRGDFQLEPAAVKRENKLAALWVYALVAPFPTVADNLSLLDLKTIWQNGGSGESEFGEIYLTADTLAGFTSLWGAPDNEIICIAKSEELLDRAWAEKNSLAIIPFESISPRWKVLQVDGMSPLDPHLDIELYPLKLYFQWVANPGIDTASLQSPPELPATNRDSNKFSTVILTGTTALVRSIAEKMEEKGVDYPAGDIAVWLKAADITHISNEVSFYQKCPPAIPVRKEMRFCSDPKYIQLFEAVGADVIESTGNHLVDWGVEPFVYTIGLYKENGFKYYGGGLNLEEARKPLILEHAGTRLAFIGCNISGPENDWATDQTAGSAPCDLEWMSAEVKKLSSEGILPIVTFQHYEVDDYQPMNLTRQHFQLMAEAGAVIVSGSQAHFPHGFAFYNGTFMHYGLGNLFFDQMFDGNRREFIDRHVFYDGHYLGVELLTAMLEDYSRPRPMTADERTQMLTTYFEASGW